MGPGNDVDIQEVTFPLLLTSLSSLLLITLERNYLTEFTLEKFNERQSKICQGLSESSALK
jgi:hypothetical protein